MSARDALLNLRTAERARHDVFVAVALDDDAIAAAVLGRVERFIGELQQAARGAFRLRLHEHAADAGRDPESIEVTAGAAQLTSDPRSAVEELEALGVDRMFVPAFLFFRSENLAEDLAAFTAGLV